MQAGSLGSEGLQRISRRSPWRPGRVSSGILAPLRNLSFLNASDEEAGRILT
jgi:hypothetical protein